MTICIAMYLALGLLFWQRDKVQNLKWCGKKEWRIMFLILLVSNTVALMIFLIQGTRISEEINRNGYGKGSKKETYVVTVESELEQEEVELEVGEREYTEEQTEKMFADIISHLDKELLGNNSSFDRVEQDLCFVEKIADYPVRIQWKTEPYGILDTEGNIIEEKVSEEGTLVKLQATLTYGEKEATYTQNIMVFPKKKSKKEAALEELHQAFAKAEESSKEEGVVKLPTEINGKEIEWKKVSDGKGYIILLLGLVCAAFIPVWKRQKMQEQKKHREEELIEEYPGIVGALALLLETGTTTKKAWEKVAHMETAQKEAYRQMQEAFREMQSGVPESEAYENFGRRCEVPAYRKCGALLSQNVRRGTKGVAQLLRMEAMQAEDNEKSRVRKKAEEAGTRLLIPMFVMLCMVLLIIMVPAFLSMQL